MKADDIEGIRKHMRIYVTVFVALAILTILTVLVSYLDHSTTVAIIIALIIAMIKASLVAGYFMHLISERKVIFGILILCALFLLVMLLVPTLASSDQVVSTSVS